MSKRILAALAGLLALTAGVASANAKPVHNTPTPILRLRSSQEQRYDWYGLMGVVNDG